VIVEISGGKDAGFEFSQNRLAKWKIHHPVLWDRDNKNARAYEISGWPSAYLIGADGKVFWQGNPAAVRGRKDEEEALRMSLRLQLDKAKAK
jgi:hypothetical protein